MSRAEAAAKAVKTGAGSGTVAAATSIVTGVAIQEVPIKLLGLITIGTSTVVCWPVVWGIGLSAGLMSAAAAYVHRRKQEKNLDEQLQDLLGE